MTAITEAARIRHIAVLRAIADGACTIPDILRTLPQYGAEGLRSSMAVLKRHGIARSAVKANSWRPAKYVLLMPLDEAKALLQPPPPKNWSSDALTQAWLPVQLPPGQSRLVQRGWHAPDA